MNPKSKIKRFRFSHFANYLFCVNTLPPQEERKGDGEHVIPQNIFGFWKSHDICNNCNASDVNGDFVQLQKGMQIIFSESYQIEKAIIYSAKTEYLSSFIKHNSTKIEKIVSPEQINDCKIKDQTMNKLNRLKKSNPEAFFYWYKPYELETGGNNG